MPDETIFPRSAGHGVIALVLSATGEDRPEALEQALRRA
jgi:hypothetical protein